MNSLVFWNFTVNPANQATIDPDVDSRYSTPEGSIIFTAVKNFSEPPYSLSNISLAKCAVTNFSFLSYGGSFNNNPAGATFGTISLTTKISNLLDQSLLTTSPTILKVNGLIKNIPNYSLNAMPGQEAGDNSSFNISVLVLGQ